MKLKSAPSLANEVDYPVVLKPLMLSGSRGVIRANNPAEFITASLAIAEILERESGSPYEKSHCLVESYLDGREIAFDAFIREGKIISLALFDKPEAMQGPYFEESYYITPSALPAAVQDDIHQEIARCCQAYGLTHGPIHAEARITRKGVYLIEMASRTIGGQCAKTVEYVLDQPLEDLVLRLACGERIEVEANRQYAGVLMIPIPAAGILKRVEGMTAAQAVEHVRGVEIHIQAGYELTPLPRGASYLGFIFAESARYEQTLNALRQAYKKLHFVVAPKWEIHGAKPVHQ